MNLLFIGDSWAAQRVMLDALNIPEELRQGRKGSTAAQWASDYKGWLSKAAATPADAVIISLGGNDAINKKEWDKYILHDMGDIVKIIKLTHEYILLMLYSTSRPEMKCRVHDMNMKILNSFVYLPNIRYINTETVLKDKADFKGIHPSDQGNVKVAELIKYKCAMLGIK